MKVSFPNNRKMLTVKYFSPIIIGKAFDMADSQCLEWCIRELLSKTLVGANIYAVTLQDREIA